MNVESIVQKFRQLQYDMTMEDENERQQGKMRMKGGNHRTSTKADSKVAD